MNSPIRWAGSKRQTLPKLRRFWGAGHARYVEPFAGSASLFFDLQPDAAILGDLNWELISALQALRQDPDLVLQCLCRMPVGRRSYHRIRAQDPIALSPAQVAARFLYLNRLCFNGLYRTNLRGRFNVPYGPPRNGARFDRQLIAAAAQALRNADLLNLDFEETLELAREGDFVFLDPPYAVDNRRVFTEYLPGSFNRRDLARLRSCLHALSKKGAGFVITYADSAESRKLLSPWGPQRIWVRRNIAGFAADRRGYYELLATNIKI